MLLNHFLVFIFQYYKLSLSLINISVNLFFSIVNYYFYHIYIYAVTSEMYKLYLLDFI